jgi:UPF0755 protein
VKRRRILLILFGLLCLAGGSVGFAFYRYATTPVHRAEKRVTVWIRPGQSLWQTVGQLQEKGLVQHPKRFRWLAYLRGDEKRIRAGEYLLQTSMSPQDILDTLVQGKGVLRKVVVPEGSTAFDIARILQERGLVSEDGFLDQVSDPALAEALGVKGPTLEGYLFPETYHFSRGISARGIIKKMVSQFRATFTPEWTNRAQTMGFTVHEAVTLASIVEKETADPLERPVIACVFLNRLKRGIKLESDPTVIYGMEGFDGNLTREDLETPTAYNTYRFAGLPPGPIANPGRAAIEAVLYPSQEPYLYFVSKNNGSHHFSTTLAEHNAMVELYQRRASGP